MARYIIEEVDKLSHRIHDFLRYARQKPPEKKVVAGGKCDASGTTAVGGTGGHGQIRVTHRFEQNLPAIQVDPEQIKEALMNLLINAREAMPEGGQLSLRTCMGAQGDVHMEVTDSGSGIAPDHISRIFEPFFTTKEYGTGLGLTNVKRLVEDNEGNLAVTSAPGEGTTCTFRFRPTAAE